MRTRTTSLPEIRFDNPRLSKIGVELITLREMRDKVVATELASPQRVEFFLLLLVDNGDGTHVVDFVEHRLHAGDVLLVKPGQVQQWRPEADFQGLMLLFTPDVLGPSVGLHQAGIRLLGLDDWPTKGAPDERLFKQSQLDLLRVRADLEAFDDNAQMALIIRHALITVMLRLGHALATSHPGQAAGKEESIHRLFNQQLNAGLTHRMTVLDHAKRLGYSESTLSRACVQVVGLTAKQVIDRRVALEAKRLLAHSQMPVAHIGHQLGFSEPTNFVKFFRRLCGETPQGFRQAGALKH